MATESVTTINSAAIDASRKLFDEHPDDVVATVKFGSEKLYELSGLFEAIGKSSEDTMIQRLSAIGAYVADDAANFMDVRQEQYGNALSASQEA